MGCNKRFGFNFTPARALREEGWLAILMGWPSRWPAGLMVTTLILSLLSLISLYVLFGFSPVNQSIFLPQQTSLLFFLK